MRIPSLKKLQESFPNVAEKNVRTLYGILRGEIEPETVPSVAAWVAECVHTPTHGEMIEKAANALLGGFGDEAVFGSSSYWPDFSYINFGDTYGTTLIFERDGEEISRVKVGTWGDEAERRGL